MIKKKISKILGLGLMIITLYSCFPGDDLHIEELDIVATDYKPLYFAANSPVTYHLPDTVGLIGIDPEYDPELTRELIDFILDQVERNFTELGYQRVDSIDTVNTNNLPDVVITVNALVVDIVGVGCVPWYGWWGWYSWYPGWGWGPGYCYPVYAYSYRSGTLTIDMVAPEEFTVQTDQNFNRVWEVGINGLLRSSQAGNQTFIRESIDKAFQQSPYLEP